MERVERSAIESEIVTRPGTRLGVRQPRRLFPASSVPRSCSVTRQLPLKAYAGLSADVFEGCVAADTEVEPDVFAESA